MKKLAPYQVFGEKIVQLRLKANLQQLDIANFCKVTQQTVSRWEKGTSRPKVEQLQLIAKILGAPENELLILAERAPSVPPMVSYVQPFPLNALPHETFETFIGDLLHALYPDAEIHQIGSRGHKQEGTDIEVVFTSNKSYSFQCKRYKEFGRQKVADAVAAHTWPATKKFIVLSRIATPQARLEIKNHKNWDIWDSDDISRKIRGLSIEAQRRLVDSFFRGQRLALLGETESGPWQTSNEFFAPFDRAGLFNHLWELIGRDAEVKTLFASLNNLNISLVFLIGTGGSGKSRILKQVLKKYESDHPHTLVRFVSPTSNVSEKNLAELDDREKIIIVDDAHNRSDLQLLFQYTTVPKHKTKLILAFRPYGLDYITAQASNFALTDEHLSKTQLLPLTLNEAEQLAAQGLQKFNGPLSAAKDIARLTLDCPLATIIGAQLVAKEKKHYELVKNEAEFRNMFMGKFQALIVGDIGFKSKSDTEPLNKLLKIIALIQPFHIEDESILSIAKQVENIPAHDTSRLLKMLEQSGVLFKRGGKYRLSPDLLADYIIEEACIGINGRSTGYAEQVFDAATNEFIEHIVVNLGRLDWCRANGDPSNSKLLDKIWEKLRPRHKYSDPYLAAATAVAYYQPERALKLAEQLIEEKRFERDLPNLIKYAGYNLAHLPRACECLWELGKRDERSLHQTELGCGFRIRRL